MASRFTEEIVNLKTLARMAQRSNGAARDEAQEIRDEVTGVLTAHDRRMDIIEEKITSLDAWAGEVASNADPDTLWWTIEQMQKEI